MICLIRRLFSRSQKINGTFDEKYWQRMRRGEHLTDDFLRGVRQDSRAEEIRRVLNGEVSQ
jgi:hypothetical protein